MQSHHEENQSNAWRTWLNGGVIFNPWVNIPVCILTTLGLAWATWRAVTVYVDVSAAAPYPDQGLDVVGTIIGAVTLGLATVALFACTIYVIIWWAQRIRRERDRQHGTH